MATSQKGTLFFWFETGMEGAYWAFSGESGPDILRDGDFLTVYDPHDASIIVWQGTVAFVMRSASPQHYRFRQVNASQQGVADDDWYDWFVGEYPAELSRDG